MVSRHAAGSSDTAGVPSVRPPRTKPRRLLFGLGAPLGRQAFASLGSSATLDCLLPALVSTERQALPFRDALRVRCAACCLVWLPYGRHFVVGAMQLQSRVCRRSG